VVIHNSVTKKVIWQPSTPKRVKCNIDGAFQINQASCCGLFRNQEVDYVDGAVVWTLLES